MSMITAHTQAPLDVVWAVVDTPVGELFLAGSQRGLARVAFSNEDLDEVKESLSRAFGVAMKPDTDHLDKLRDQIGEYFAGTRTQFSVPIDYSHTHGFRRTVIEYLPHIEYGTTQTYSQVAKGVGSPSAARAVGSACATNPVPVILPCHRVLRADGGLGGYIGGVEAKKVLLDLEARG